MLEKSIRSPTLRSFSGIFRKSVVFPSCREANRNLVQTKSVSDCNRTSLESKRSPSRARALDWQGRQKLFHGFPGLVAVLPASKALRAAWASSCGTHNFPTMLTGAQRHRVAPKLFHVRPMVTRSTSPLMLRLVKSLLVPAPTSPGVGTRRQGTVY